MKAIRTIDSPSLRLSFDSAREFVNSVRTQELYCDRHNVRFLASGVIEANGHRLPLLDTGLTSLCKTLSIPLGYATRIPLELLEENINRLLNDTHPELLVRAQHWPVMNDMAVSSVTNATAFFLPHRTFLECLATLQKDMKFDVERVHLEPGFLSAEITFGEAIDIFPNDYFRMGCEIAAYQSVTIQAYVYRLVCENGLVAPRTFDQVTFRPSRRMKVNTMVSLIEHGLSRIYDRTKEIKDHLQAAGRSRMKKDDAEWLFRRLRRRISHDALASFDPKNLSQKTYYEVLNEVTNIANEARDVEGKRYFQTLGGVLLEKAVVSKN